MFRKISSRGLSVLIFLAAAQAQAAGWTNSATPTGFDFVTVAVPGIMVYGEFGNANSCSMTDRFFMPKAGNEQQYTQIVAALLSANALGRKVQVWISSCTEHPWYSSPGTTYNTFMGAHLSFRD
jgi:hypothetical protein